jgi:hypothetical protein
MSKQELSPEVFNEINSFFQDIVIGKVPELNEKSLTEKD